MLPLPHTVPDRASAPSSRPGMGRTQLARLSPFPLEGLSRPEPQPLPSHGPSASSSPFPQLGGGEWAGGRRSRLRSLMISCPHHSFLSHAGGEEEQRQAGSKRGAGTAGHRDRASGSWGTGPSSGSEPRNCRHRPHTQSSEEVGSLSPKGGRSCLPLPPDPRLGPAQSHTPPAAALPRGAAVRQGLGQVLCRWKRTR